MNPLSQSLLPSNEQNNHLSVEKIEDKPAAKTVRKLVEINKNWLSKICENLPLHSKIFEHLPKELLVQIFKSILNHSSPSERVQEVSKLACVSKEWKTDIEIAFKNFFSDKSISVRTDLNISKENPVFSMIKVFSDSIQSLDFRKLTSACIKIT